MSDLFTPPKWFADVKFHRHTDRSIGWLELFYDLVYVATLIQIGNFLSSNLTLLGFGQFVVMLTIIWWAWTGETFYQNRYVVDDLTHRLLVFTQIFAIASIGLSVSEAFGDLYVQFTLAYVVARLMLVLMFVRAYRADAGSRGLMGGYIAGFSFGIVIWLGSLLLPPSSHWVGWLIGIGVELSVPQLPRIRKHRREWGLDLHHISERFGIFTIIVLGESFVKILDDAQGTTINANALIFSIFGLTVVYSLWWLYFGDTAGKVIDLSSEIKANGWVYAHLPLAMGLVAFGVAAKKLFSSAVSYPNDVLNPDYRLLYTVAIVLYLVALAIIDFGLDDDETPQNQRHEAIVHIISAVIVGVIGLTATGATAITFVMMIAIVMVVQVIYSIYQETQFEFEKTGETDI